MSKSKRAQTRQTSISVPREKGKVFIDGKGNIRTGWLLAASLLSYALVAVAARYGLVQAFAALFEAWGIDATNASRAPGWARMLYVWHGSLVTLLFALLTLALCRGLTELWRLPKQQPGEKGGARFFLPGAVVALGAAAMCLLPDSSRFQWPVSSPRWSVSLPVLCGISLFATWAEESFTKRVLLDGLLMRWGRPWAEIIACGAFLLIGGGLSGNGIGAVNVLLLGGLCGLLYERHGLWPAVFFRWGWSTVNAFILGFGGGGASLYRLYGVSETLLTGGDAGPACGLWTTLLFAGGILWMVQAEKKQVLHGKLGN